MAKVRVKELAKQMGISTKDLVFKLQSLGAEVEGPESAIDHEVIVAILTGKKLVTRPRSVIMRDESAQPVTEKKRRAPVRPPRPIIEPPKRKKAVELTPSSTGPVIKEFLEAAEAEAAEQAKVASEPAPAREEKAEPRKAARAAKPATVEKEPAAKKTTKKSTREKPAATPGPAEAGPEKPTGPTGPRARSILTPRPNYQGAPRVAPPSVRKPAARARATEAAGGPAFQPGPVPVGETETHPSRRRRGGEETDRIDRKKSVGKRSRRSAAIEREGAEFLNKAPFSATAVLDDDGEEAKIQHTPSSRKDSRKQARPVTAKVLDFKRPEEVITLSEGVTVKELADKLGVKANDLMKHLMMKKGLMLSMNAPLGGKLALEIAEELNITAELVSFEEALEIETLEKIAGEEGVNLSSRAPVITVMGHVDHGKTSLLDAIRETKVAEGEAGGITQHIGAYKVEKNGHDIVFLDTPGHEAFTLMRARGAKVTDIVVLVVAADDGVMPQTKEAIDHARAAKVPMIVAINKIDKPEANLEKVRQELSQANVLVEDWGGDVVSVQVSAKKRQGIDDLLDMILLTSEMLELKSSPETPARGVVLEAKKEAGRGITATVLIQEGTLRVGDSFFSGTATGKVRAMSDDRGKRVKEAPPATPVVVMGFDDVPGAGDTFAVVDEESQARMITEIRQQKLREEKAKTAGRMSLDQLFEKMQKGEVKELNVIVKADVQGSVEVLGDTLAKLSTDAVKLKVIHASVGAVSTNDVLLASASDAIIVGFSVRPEKNASELARKEQVEIRLHTVIYELVDELRAAMAGLLEPIYEEVFQGRAEVRNTFKVPRSGTVAGCYVTEGVIPRSGSARLLRDNRVIHQGKIGSLRRFKDDVSEVTSGFECGIGLERFQDVKVGDIIEAFKVEERAAEL